MPRLASNNRPFNRGLAAQVANYRTIMAVVLDRFEVVEDALTRNDQSDLKRALEKLQQSLGEAREMQSSGTVADEQVWVGVFIDIKANPGAATLFELAGPWPKHKEQLAGELTPEDVANTYRHRDDAERLRYKIRAFIRHHLRDSPHDPDDPNHPPQYAVYYSPVYLTIPRVVR